LERGRMDSMLGIGFRLRQVESLFAEESVFLTCFTCPCCSLLQHVTSDRAKYSSHKTSVLYGWIPVDEIARPLVYLSQHWRFLNTLNLRLSSA
jgi:hypothetical protein